MRSWEEQPSAGTVPTRLRAGYRIDPVGIPARALTLTWEAATHLERGAAYEVRLRDLDAGDVWSVRSDRPSAIVPADRLRSRTRLAWTVTAEGAESSEASFEVGLDEPGDWSARWVSAPSFPFAREGHDPVPYLRRTFDVDEVPAQARLYMTALGVYRVWLNGVELTLDELLRPGWTEYRVRAHHQTYVVDEVLRPGRNVIVVALAKGWYAGRVGLLRHPGLYGRQPALLAQLEAVTGAGSAPSVLCASDDAWVTTPSAVQASDLLRGEVVDRRREPAGWAEGETDTSGWDAVVLRDDLDGTAIEITPQPHDSVRVLREHPGVLVHEHGRGPVVFDFGQNLVGWTRISSPLLADTEVVVRHGEILTPENLVYRDNLRGAFQEDRYVDEADGVRQLETSFTLHGFRYAEVWGLPSGDPYGATRLREDSTITAVSVTQVVEGAGGFTSSHAGLNRLAESIAWTVRDNFIEVATDCPQRDERLGWLGDAGVIAPTASCFFDVAAFLAKFAQDAVDGQGPDGEIRSYVPVVPPADARPGAPGWADGYIRIVHLLARTYGDLATAERHLDPILRFLDHVDRHNPDGLRVAGVGADFADWLSLPETDDEPLHPGYAWTGAHSTSPRPVVDTAHSYRSFVQAAEIARLLGREDEAARLAERAEQVRAAYLAAYVDADGRIADATQTVYAQAVGFGLLQGEHARGATARLRELIERRGYLTTGIHGVQHVLPTLARHGAADLAVDLLLREDMPSWLWMVGQGGTTVWEKWDGIRPDGTLATAEMNSFNHCALGAVGAFLFEDLLGLRVDEAATRGILTVAPLYTSRLDWVDGAVPTAVGTVASRWEHTDDGVTHRLEVPGGLRAELVVPQGYVAEDPTRERPDRVVLGPGRHEVALRRQERA